MVLWEVSSQIANYRARCSRTSLMVTTSLGERPNPSGMSGDTELLIRTADLLLPLHRKPMVGTIKRSQRGISG